MLLLVIYLILLGCLLFFINSLKPSLSYFQLVFVSFFSFFDTLSLILAARCSFGCSLSMILLDSALNSFLLVWNTFLQIGKCFSSAFFVNILPQPSSQGNNSSTRVVESSIGHSSTPVATAINSSTLLIFG